MHVEIRQYHDKKFGNTYTSARVFHNGLLILYHQAENAIGERGAMLNALRNGDIRECINMKQADAIKSGLQSDIERAGVSVSVIRVPAMKDT